MIPEKGFLSPLSLVPAGTEKPLRHQSFVLPFTLWKNLLPVGEWKFFNNAKSRTIGTGCGTGLQRAPISAVSQYSR